MYRRELARSIAAAAVFVPTSAAATKQQSCVEECRETAEILAASMQELFGGSWCVSVQADFILISKDC